MLNKRDKPTANYDRYFDSRLTWNAIPEKSLELTGDRVNERTERLNENKYTFFYGTSTAKVITTLNLKITETTYTGGQAELRGSARVHSFQEDRQCSFYFQLTPHKNLNIPLVSVLIHLSFFTNPS